LGIRFGAGNEVHSYQKPSRLELIAVQLGCMGAKSLEFVLEEVESSEHKRDLIAPNAKVQEFLR